jgi:hypothetical protein
MAVKQSDVARQRPSPQATTRYERSPLWVLSWSPVLNQAAFFGHWHASASNRQPCTMTGGAPRDARVPLLHVLLAMPYRAALAACWAVPLVCAPVGLCPVGCAAVGAGLRCSRCCAVPRAAATDGTWSVAIIVRLARRPVNRQQRARRGRRQGHPRACLARPCYPGGPGLHRTPEP